MFQSGNPVLTKQDIWARSGSGDVMTVQGAVTKTIFALLVTIGAAAFVWRAFMQHHDANAIMPYVVVGVIGGAIVGLVNAFRGAAGPISTTLYAGFEGLAIGGISALVEVRYPGIPMQAVALTLGVMLAVLGAYKARIVQATEGFKMGLCAAMSGLCLVYLVNFVLHIFGSGIPYIHESGPIGIAFSVFVVGLAALNLVLDFDLIERGARSGAPKQLEWYAAFGLLVTLIWLYLEILRLLMKLQDRDRSSRADS
jgi:uncharacterized YccA/Bax inhibitor family protein